MADPVTPPPVDGAADDLLVDDAPPLTRTTRLVARLRALPASTWMEVGVSAFIVAAVTVFTLGQLQPDLLLADTTPTGGDMGAHVWGPAYLRDTLLPQGQLSGWSPDWYAGFPAYQFYMVVPSLAIVALDVVLPYGIAFKLITVAGLLTLPAAAWAFGRLARLAFPGPPLLAAATLPFLFDPEFTIYGGNVASTMAGEFAFSISLSFAVLYLGVVARGLETGRWRALAAVLLALTGLCHLIPAFFALAGTVVLFALRWGWARLRWLAVVGPVAALLSAFWVLPFVARRNYLNDMGWEKIEPWADHPQWSWAWWGRLGDSLWHSDIRWFVAFAIVGVIVAIVERDRVGGFFAVMVVIFAVAFVLAPQGRLWNARLLPFYYLMVYLLAGYALSELSRALARQYAARADRVVAPTRWLLGFLAGIVLIIALPAAAGADAAVGRVAVTLGQLIGIGLVIAVLFDLARAALRSPAEIDMGVRALAALGTAGVLLAVVAMPLESLPGGSHTATGAFRWLGFETAAEDLNFVDGWARWNFAGVERKAGNDSGGGYPEYHDVVTTMETVGEERGCGRAMWEYERELDRYGTPMALMLLPFWTDGCIGSMEGLFFEASATTPYHFVNQSELSEAPSRAQRELPYPEFDIEEGVAHLQLMGVRYYMAFSAEALAAAAQHPDLTEIASSGPWVVYEVADAELVAPLDYEPAVLDGITDAGADWLEPSVEWYIDPDAREVLLASSGPDAWDRIDPGQTAPRVAIDPAQVSGIEATDDRISFDVDQIGSPVLVKASYFPNWQASGAEGPYRVTPNLMVVVPTDEHVDLRYGRTGVDFLAIALTLLGLAAVVWLTRRPSPPMPAVGGESDPPPET